MITADHILRVCVCGGGGEIPYHMTHSGRKETHSLQLLVGRTRQEAAHLGGGTTVPRGAAGEEGAGGRRDMMVCLLLANCLVVNCE